MNRKSLTLTFVLTLLIALLLSTTAFAASNVWQIGTYDGNVNPIVGSAEYPANEMFYDTFDYYVVSDANPNPDMPAYIGPENVCAVDSSRPCTDTTAELNIHFDLACTYGEGQLELVYSRYGSEADDLYLDGNLIDRVSATEGGHKVFSFSLPALGAGDHVFTIDYIGGGDNNGHYIDSLTLEAEHACVSAEIDIKPGSYPNSFNVNGKGVVPVAILGSATFDVTQIDVSTLSFAGLAVRVKGNGSPQCSVEDVSGANMPYGEPDGYDDLVCQFVDDATTWSAGDATARIEGSLFDGTLFSGADSINIVP